MAKIISPNKKYKGISAGVTFIDGVGQTTDERVIKWFKSKGYKVEENLKDVVLETAGTKIVKDIVTASLKQEAPKKNNKANSKPKASNKPEEKQEADDLDLSTPSDDETILSIMDKDQLIQFCIDNNIGLILDEMELEAPELAEVIKLKLATLNEE